MKDVIVLGGPNGAGKTTAAARLLPQTLGIREFVNADEFLWLPSPEAALARVARRVSGGGHAVSDAVVIRRYGIGLRNMRHMYLPLMDAALIYDNSDQDGGILIAECPSKGEFIIHDAKRWSRIEEATR